MYMKVLIYAITALASFLSFEAVHQGLVVYNGWPTPPYWSPAPTPPSRPRKPNAKDFANLYDAAEVFNSSNLLPLNPLYESLFKLSRCEAPIEHKDQPAPSPPTWRDLLWRSVRDLLQCELRLYWWIERVFWFCLLGQHVKATETERQEQCRLEETRAETRQAEAEQLGRESAELRKKVASIREEHDGKLADLKSAQLVEMEDERKEHTATREEHNKLLSKIDDLEQRNVKLEHDERQQKLDASERKASQVKLELLRRELAALHEKETKNIDVALRQSKAEFAGIFTELKASRTATTELQKNKEELQKKCDELSHLKSKTQADVIAAEEKAKSLEAELEVIQRELLEAKATNKTVGKTFELNQVDKGLSCSSWASGNDNPLGTGDVKQLKMTINELEKQITELEVKIKDQAQMLNKSWELNSTLGRDNYYLKDRMANQAFPPKARPYGSSNPYLGASSASAAVPVSQANTLQSPTGQVPNLLYAQQQQTPLPPPQPIPYQNTQSQFPNLPRIPPNIQHQPPNMPHAQHQQHHHYQPGLLHQPSNLLSAQQQQQQQQHQPRPEAPAFISHRPPPRNMPSRQIRGHQDHATIDSANPGFLKKEW